MGYGVGKLPSALPIVLPTEQFIDHVYIAEQVGDHPMVGFTLHVVE